MFESIGEVPSTDVPEMEPIVRSEVNTGRESIGGDTPPRTTGRVVNVVPPDIDEPDEPAALDKKVMNKFVFFRSGGNPFSGHCSVFHCGS